MIKKTFLSLLIFNIAYVPTIQPTLNSKFLPYHSFGWRKSLFTILGISAITAGFYYGWRMFKTGSTSNASKTRLPTKTNQMTLSADSDSKKGCTLTYSNGEVIYTDKRDNEDAVTIDLPNGIFCLCSGSEKQEQDGTVFGQFSPREIAEKTARELPALLLNNDSQPIRKNFADFHESIKDYCKISAPTALIAYIKNNIFVIAQIGNSCAFLFKNKQQTIEPLIPTQGVYGQILEHSKPKYNLGTQDFCADYVRTEQRSLDNDDLVILVSDGITKELKPTDMINIIKTTQPPTPGNIAQALVKQARSNAINFRGPVYTINDQTAVVIRYSTK